MYIGFPPTQTIKRPLSVFPGSWPVYFVFGMERLIFRGAARDRVLRGKPPAPASP